MLIDQELITEQNTELEPELFSDFEHLGAYLERRGVAIDGVVQRVRAFTVAIPTWGVSTGGTRFSRFPMPGEPRNIFERLEDCAVVQQLGRATPRVSPHMPWDHVDDIHALRLHAEALGLGFDAVNSNTFQDQLGQDHSYKYGSLTHTDPAVRAQAITHNLECIAIGEQLGSTALTVWIADGANFPGQQHFALALDRYLGSMREIYAQLPEGWKVFLEHKLYEPALYATVIADWGTSYFCAESLGPKAQCLVDLGHHAPTTNVEMIVARLIQLGKLGGFHFNDSKYGDDDLDTGAIDPFRIFLVFNELIDAEVRQVDGFAPAYMLDQSHNVTDPIESLIESTAAVQRALAQALVVNREALAVAQETNDALGAARLLREATQINVEPIVQRARLDAGGAIDPVTVYRASTYRKDKVTTRPAERGGHSGIV
ncbi:MAG: L-rhamnose catabolism isomerase [Vicinamibacterales bacterium]|nr:L-rhamnose catabolism isomerase [Acidobacteriota bacterium]MDP7211202.1 L-rhamnose catabolism isomerase [Vicinamibacterales bacterium]HJO16899.1 L-rhamnose catabolism isomerase [Vicinamibacterales bacterium]